MPTTSSDAFGAAPPRPRALRRRALRPRALAACAALALLAGCGTSTVSRGVADDGRAQQIVFPDIEQTAWLKEGTFPNLDNLRRIAPGVTKDQLYALVGRPHFRESMMGVREWDYIFNFRTPEGVKRCQYKVLFDKALQAQQFHWQPAACAELLKVAAPAPAPVAERVVERVVEKQPLTITQVMPPAPPAPPRRVELSADALFKFGRAGLADLQPQGRRELDALADSLREVRDVRRLTITGHTDRLGSDAFNQRLSLQRAETVREYLVRAGVPAANVSVYGLGKSEPKVFCDQKNRQQLIDCLAPNRRVEIEVAATR